jgi:hypothetical protein
MDNPTASDALKLAGAPIAMVRENFHAQAGCASGSGSEAILGFASGAHQPRFAVEIRSWVCFSAVKLVRFVAVKPSSATAAI